MSGLTKISRYMDPAIGELLGGLKAPRRALFLDRDGVINVDHGYVHTPAETDWIPGVFEMCRTARDHGYLLVVVTNQAGIARGLYSEATFLEYTRWMHGEFSRYEVPLAATYYCPHHPAFGSGNQCGCRKPAPGLIHAAAHDFSVDQQASVLLGNKASDIEAGRAAGVVSNILFGSEQEQRTDALVHVKAMVDVRQLLFKQALSQGAIHAGR